MSKWVYMSISKQVLEYCNSDQHKTFLPDPPITSITDILSYGIGDVHVNLSLHWIPEDIVTYAVEAVPHVNVNFTASTTVHLRLVYNTAYNISIAASLCNVTASTFIELNFSKPHEIQYARYDLIWFFITSVQPNVAC